jgi:quercetin dioxygenase-like cupin family protein
MLISETRMTIMTNTSTRIRTAALALCLIPMLALLLVPEPVAAQHAHAEVTPLMAKDLPELPGREVTMITVVYPPGSSDPVHRHDAHAFVYVLEGSIVMQVKGGKQVTLTPGQTYYEGPDDLHVVGRNASDTEPAKFVVVLIKGKGAPILTPVE